MKHYQYNFINVFSNFSWKKVLIFLPAPFLAQIETVIYPLIGLLIVIMADLFTALVAHFYQVKRTKKRKLLIKDYRYGIISGGLRQTIKKSYQYGMAAIVVFLVEIFGFGGKLHFTVPLVNLDATLTQFILWAFIMIEVKSIDENLENVSGKSFIDSITGIFTYFREIIARIVGPKDKITPTWEDGEDPNNEDT